MDQISDCEEGSSDNHGDQGVGTNSTALTAENTTIVAPIPAEETTPVEDEEKQQPHAAGEITNAEEKIARVVTANQVGAFYMSGELGSKEDISVDRVEITSGSADDSNGKINSAARREEDHEQTTEEGALVTTAVLVDASGGAAAIVDNETDGIRTIMPNQDVSNMTIEHVFVDGQEDPDREVPLLVEASPLEKETLKGLCRNQKVQLLLLLVVVVTVSITVGVVSNVLPLGGGKSRQPEDDTLPSTLPPTPAPPPRPPLSREEFIQNLLPEYTRAALEDVISPQSHAMRWLWEEGDSSLPSWRKVQRFALATCAISTTANRINFEGALGLQNFGWLTAEHECKWFSQSASSLICDSSGRYQVLDISGSFLAGTIPPEAALLTSLVYIDLSGNSAVHGTIPSQIMSLKQMEQLYLRGTNMTGTIPTSMGGWKHLTVLDLADSRFSGSVPSELGQLTNLVHMSLENNALTSVIPSEFGQLGDLFRFEVYSNLLTGTIPTTLAQMSSVSIIALSENRLTGTLPTQFGQLPELKTLYLNDNTLSGTIPSELGALSLLEDLRCHDNARLSGTISEAVCQSLCVQFISIDCDSIACDCDCTCGSDV